MVNLSTSRTTLRYEKEASIKRSPGCKQPGKARVYLWKFLYNLLEMDTKRELIEWRCKDLLEFQIKQPKETARLWGSMKNKHNFVYSELARGIRYYYGKGVIEKVPGVPYCFRFVRSSKTEYVLGQNKETMKKFGSTKDGFQKASDSQESFCHRVKTEVDTTSAIFNDRGCSYHDVTTSTYNKVLNGTSSYAYWRAMYFNLDMETVDNATEQMNKTLKSENDSSFNSCSQIIDPVREKRLMTKTNPSSIESLKMCPDLQDIYLDLEFFQSLDMEKFSHILNDISNQSLNKI